MAKDISQTAVLDAIHALDKKFSTQLVNTIDALDKKFSTQLSGVINALDTKFNVKFDALDKKFTDKFDDVLAIVRFMQDEMVTKTELENKFTEFESRFMNHIDGTLKLYTKLDTEYASLHSKTDRHDMQIKHLAKHTRCKLPNS
ncbi:MAG: hypothetical protein A3J66_02505 [Candidatus Magasanikbacteria bacterium RIFCSPHIGHO2_02_FULL_47_14]|uniref:Uncharacterized protein n=1 Tax=Candidatus Magasanikbacteria bacterium RIFCSPHIGHO2_02_FULL_47_14 TaxID=1798680 RepID=A0A1F6M8B0_9BACT|nr:MAG: hypothetical protein A3J66_02505 [Candidatus Magasanikbacteria bacterium RIFCSPHIGHO2_02_FULL_47_14]